MSQTVAQRGSELAGTLLGGPILNRTLGKRKRRPLNGSPFHRRKPERLLARRRLRAWLRIGCDTCADQQQHDIVALQLAAIEVDDRPDCVELLEQPVIER